MTRGAIVVAIFGMMLSGAGQVVWAQASSIEGKAIFAGDPSQYPREFVSATSDKGCGEGAAVKEDVFVNPTKPPTLRNVVVSVRQGLGRTVFFLPKDEVRMTIQDCRFVPHVVDLNEGQPLRLVNMDNQTHKIRILASVNEATEIELPGKEAGGKDVVLTFKAEAPIQLVNAEHPNLTAFVSVFDQPFHDVTKSDGSFTMVGLRPGTYLVDAWHEVFGGQSTWVVVEKAGKGMVDFVFPEPVKNKKGESDKADSGGASKSDASDD